MSIHFPPARPRHQRGHVQGRTLLRIFASMETWGATVPRESAAQILPRVQIPVTPADGYDHLRLAVPPRCGLRVVCISDTHNAHRDLQLPAGDVLIHAGDFTQFGKEEHASDFNDWLGDARWSVFGAHHFVNCVTSIKLQYFAIFFISYHIIPYYVYVLCILTYVYLMIKRVILFQPDLFRFDFPKLLSARLVP